VTGALERVYLTGPDRALVSALVALHRLEERPVWRRLEAERLVRSARSAVGEDVPIELLRDLDELAKDVARVLRGRSR
jgi:hypothetical protein